MYIATVNYALHLVQYAVVSHFALPAFRPNIIIAHFQNILL